MRPMRRKDRQISPEEAKKLMQDAEYGVLSTAAADGEPYGVPLSFVMLAGHLYFHCAREGQKLDNLAANSRASFCVVGKTQPVYEGDYTTYFESAIAFGTAVRVEDEAEKIAALRALCEKYLPAHMDMFEKSLKSLPVTEVVRLDIEHMTGKAKRAKPM